MPRRAGLNKEVVVAAAARLLDEEPSRELSLTMVASRLGVRVPSLYNHIGGLDDLRQAVAVHAVRQLGDRLGQAAIGRSGEDALYAIAWAYRDFANQHKGMHRATQRAPEPGQDELEEAAGVVLGILARVLEPFELSHTEQIHVIRALRALVHGFVTLEQAGGFGLPVDLDESFRYLTGIYVQQVAGASATAATAGSAP